MALNQKRSDSVISTVIDIQKRTLTFKVKGVGEMTLDLNNVSESNRDYVSFHGFKQRIVDGAALGFNKDENRYATPQEKHDAMKELVDWYNSGADDWSPKRGVRISTDEVLLARCLGELYPEKTGERIREYVAGLNKPQRSALLNEPQLKAIADRLRNEQAQGVDTEDLLSKL